MQLQTSSRDVTDRVQAEQELAQRNRELQEFAYVASHDLKAPLRAIGNLSEWMEEDAGPTLPPTAREQLKLLRNRVHRMEALIDGILAYSRAGRVREPAVPVDVNALLREVTDMVAPPANVRLEVQPAFPTLTAERVPLQQVFLNLLTNAIKFSAAHTSTPYVRVGWADQGDAFRFSVTDNGPGIDPQYHDRIWGIFQTLETRDKIEGAGIGLSVVQKVVEARGGRIWVESELGKGATFSFTWPKTATGA
ncbi:MAG: sensor histidine kinase [Myxococcales bacterium]